MKILKLHFKNLNSLLGEWVIDFTVPEYMQQGIFAITGPTGAGKSTILDAICLALYGRTPRLDKINASQNEIMSRQSGECFASLEFRTSSGHYRSLWSQAKARKKAEGNLQNAQHSIEDCLSNKTLEDKLSKTPQVVSAVTGMDFEHFTRAMLLAQGGFAKFLQSSADERSPILEKITGSEIYSQISILVHTRKTLEDNKLTLLTQQLAGINLLAASEIEALQSELAEFETKLCQLSASQSAVEQQQAWVISLQNLREELTIITAAQQQLQLATAEFAPDELRLQQAKLAAEINSDIYINLIALRKRLADLTYNIATNQQQLPQVIDKIILQQNLFAERATAFNDYKLTYANNLKLLQEVRLLDAGILAKRTRLSTDHSKLTTSQAALSQLEEQRQSLSQQQQAQRQQHIQIEDYLAANPQDAELITNLSGICAQLDSFAVLSGRMLNVTQQISQERANSQGVMLQLQDVEQGERQCRAEQDLLNLQISQLTHESQQIANGKNLLEIKDHILQLTTRHNDYRELGKSLHEKISLDLQLKSLAEELIVAQEVLSTAQPRLIQASELFATTNQLIENLTTQKVLQSKIVSLSAERDNLQANQPCPLCGALEHPYVMDVLPVDNQLDREIAQHKIHLSEGQHEINQLNVSIATSQAQISKLKLQQAEIAGRQVVLQEQISAQLVSSNWSENSSCLNNELAAQIQRKLAECATQISHAQQQVSQLQSSTAKLSELSAKQQQLQHELTQLTISYAELSAKHSASQASIVESEQNLRVSQAESELLLSLLTTQLSAYQINSIASAEVTQIKTQLQHRLSAWQATQHSAEKLKEAAQQVTSQIEQNLSLQASLIKQLDVQRSDINLQQADLESLAAQRFTLFADKDPAHAEEMWQQELNTLEIQSKSAENGLNQLQQVQASLIAVIEKDQRELLPLQADCSVSEQSFMSCLQGVNFVDENDFIAKLLPREVLATLQARHEALTQQAIELASRAEQTSLRLCAEEAKQLTQKTSAELHAELVNLQLSAAEYHQRIGEIRGIMLANQQALSQQKDIIERSEQQRLISERFARLHKLIGSADGKKFRNFAQGLTFELVVKHANQQLRQMSERYLLIRNKELPLELSVIDNYQGGDVRSTKNLSGGESFVVSLALALGLSKLSSNKVQVDSLFLDEGFGTLDEDSLQTALDALDALQRDGKLIGVISHVGALKERISLQIQVEPLSGGVSQLSGVGCRRG